MRGPMYDKLITDAQMFMDEYEGDKLEYRYVMRTRKFSE
jgi:hypothetical protein